MLDRTTAATTAAAAAVWDCPASAPGRWWTRSTSATGSSGTRLPGGAAQAQAHLAALLALAREKHIHLMLEQPGGGYFQTFEALCLCPPPHGLGWDAGALEALVAERQDIRVQARLARPLRAPGQHGPYRPERRAAGDAPPGERIKHGTGRRYWLAKLARDRPDLLRQVESGAITSAHAAAALAGWTSPLVWCRRTPESFAAQAVKHLTEQEVVVLLAYLRVPSTIPRAQSRRTAQPGTRRTGPPGATDAG